MGSDLLQKSPQAAGKQTLTSHSNDAVGTPGKTTLTERLPTTTEGLIAFVKPHAGATVTDGGGYTFRVTDAGTFEITGTPKGRETSIHHIISPASNAHAWHLVATKLLSEAPPKPMISAVAPAAAAPPPPPPPPPAPGLLDRAMRTVDAGLHELREGASSLWDRATSLLPGVGEDAAPANTNAAPEVAKTPSPATTPNASTPAASTPAAPAKAPAKAPTPSGPVDNSDVPAEFQAGVGHVRTKTPMANNTLDLAMSRAKLGTAGTEYTLNGLPHADALRLKEVNALLAKHAAALKVKAKAKDKTATVEGELSEDDLEALTDEKTKLDAASTAAQKVLAAEIASGQDDVTRFYCSGLSMWTLAAAGYDITKRLKGPDGTEYRGLIMSKTEVPVDAAGKPVKKGGKAVRNAHVVTDTKYVTLRSLVDGDPFAIEIVTRAKVAGTSTVEITGTGYQTEDGGTGLADGAHGAASAFEAAGIGTEVDELQQKPGDFAQSRRTTTGNDKELKHRGAGHAWQVADVKAFGSALFGKTNSPESTDKLDGWHENVPFIIKPTTNPRLVGAHTVKAAMRVEAQDETVVDQKADTGKDGGVQVTGWKDAPDAGLKKYTGYVVFYGRLGTSGWSGWSPATKESATAAAAAAASAPAKTEAGTPASTPPVSTPPVSTPPAQTGDTQPHEPHEPLPAGTPAGELTGGDERHT